MQNNRVGRKRQFRRAEKTRIHRRTEQTLIFGRHQRHQRWAAITKMEGKATLLRLGQNAAAEKRLNRKFPTMPLGLNRTVKATIRRIATNTALAPALRDRVLGEDPDGGSIGPAATKHLA